MGGALIETLVRVRRAATIMRHDIAVMFPMLFPYIVCHEIGVVPLRVGRSRMTKTPRWVKFVE